MILDAPVAKPADINFITSEGADEDDQELIPIRLNDEAEEVRVTLPADIKLISYALKYAIEDGCKEMVELLIKRGAKVNLPYVHIAQPLNVAINQTHPNSAVIFEILCRNGADIFFTDPQEHVKAVTNCFRTFASLPSGQYIGAFPDRKEWLRHKLKTMIEFSNLDLNAKGNVILEPVDDDAGKSVLARIVTHPMGSIDMADVMLDLGARVDVPDDNGETVYKFINSSAGVGHPLQAKVNQRMQDHIAEYLVVKQEIPAPTPVVSVGSRKQLKLTL
jgi:hypothetical protein